MRRRQQPWPLWTPNRVMGRHYGMGRPLRKPCVAAAITVWVDHYWHPALQLPLRYGLTIMDTQSCDGPPLRYGLTITDTLRCGRHYGMGWPLLTPCIAAAIKVWVDHYGHPIVWWTAITVWVDHYGHPALRPPLRYWLTIMDTQSCDGPPLQYGLTIMDTLRCGRHYGMGWPLLTFCIAAAITVWVDQYGHPIVWWAAITVWVDHYGHPVFITNDKEKQKNNHVMGGHYGMGDH